jgi:cell division protease FtsH
MGPARYSLVLNSKEKLSTAYHEAGHTLVGRILPDADPVHKVTIIPRGQALGVTSALPEEDRYSISRSYCLAMIRVLMAGRAAEDIIFGEFNSGATNDLKRATQLVHKMVCEWGMSQLGPISFGSDDEVFLGRDFTRTRDFSEETASAVDREVHRILDEAYRDAKGMLQEHEQILRALAEALFERETLDAAEIDAIIRKHGGEDILAERPADKPKPPRRAKKVQAPDAQAPEQWDDLPQGDVAPGTA